MSPIVLLLIGLALVLGGILWLKLHPFLALMLGAFVVGGLTSSANLEASLESKYFGDSVRSAIAAEVRTQADALSQSGEQIDFVALREVAKQKVYSQKRSAARRRDSKGL